MACSSSRPSPVSELSSRYVFPTNPPYQSQLGRSKNPKERFSFSNGCPYALERQPAFLESTN
jgi:hypothetical protein